MAVTGRKRSVQTGGAPQQTTAAWWQNQRAVVVRCSERARWARSGIKVCGHKTEAGGRNRTGNSAVTPWDGCLKGSALLYRFAVSRTVAVFKAELRLQLKPQLKIAGYHLTVLFRSPKCDACVTNGVSLIFCTYFID